LEAWAYLIGRKKVCTVMLVGDEIADGFGDTLTSGGLAPRVHSHVARYGKSNMNLLLPWRVVSRGRLGSTSRSWLPTSESAKNAYFLNVFNSGRFCNAEVIVLFIGSNDETEGIPPHETVENIQKIAEDLSARDKKVIVSSVALLSEDPKARTSVLQRNQKLVDWLSQESTKKRGIFTGPDLMKVVDQGQMLVMYAGYTLFNDTAYRYLTSLVLDELRNPMKQVEWPRLSGMMRSR